MNMADSRRSSRARKAVNYSGFVGGEDDDDFADPTPPPKKTKTSNKENQLTKKDRGGNTRQTKDSQADPNESAVDCKKRRPPNEKVFDRDLEAALKLSLESSGSAEISEVIAETHVEKEAPSETVLLDSSKPTDATPVSSKRPLPSTTEDDLEIIELSSELEDVTGNTRKRRKAAAKPVICEDNEDSDDDKDVWNPGKASSDNVSDVEDNNSDDEFDPDDSDSDFGSSKKKKPKGKPRTTRKTPVKGSLIKSTPKAVTPVSTSRSMMKVASKSTSKSAPSTYSTPVRVSGGSVKRAWVPPSRAASTGSPLSSISIKSPSSGLRLGLSRNQRVKSLHPTVTT